MTNANIGRLIELAAILDDPEKSAELLDKIVNSKSSSTYGFNDHKNYTDYVAEQIAGIKVGGNERMCSTWNKSIKEFRATLKQVAGRFAGFETRVEKNRGPDNTTIFVKRVF